MHVTNTTLTADLKVMSAVLNKNICAIAAVVAYDLLTQQDSMKQDDQFKFCFNAFHGNDDSNIISQVDLLLQGHRFYGMLYDIKPPTPVTDCNTEESIDDASVFVLKERYGQSNVRFILGKHFTKSSLSSPTKARLEEKVTGRYIYDLALTVINFLKKASSIAEEWLDDDGNLSSGKIRMICMIMLSHSHTR